ncbi:MAG: quinolinate synthase NadA [Candidatus Kapabacteria bacterium]|nr:quinolinate synthase NadA [Candidatus Kapabacteria bacterium]
MNNQIIQPYIGSSKIDSIYRRINELKKDKDVVILSHYYMSPELQVSTELGGVADFIGDSLALSLAAKNTRAKNIVFCGVKFMAETAKILNPTRNVFISDMEAGCSLASSITGEDVRNLKAKYPGLPIIAYINTNAETKAECDICCTSRNAMSIARSFKEDRIIFIPDVYMGQNLSSRVKAETGKEFILWDGRCEVHEQFTSSSMESLKMIYPNAELLMHWEVPEESVNSAFADTKGVLGSTGDIISYVGKSDAKQFILASECDLGATLKGMYKDKEFITPCVKCPYMKKITLENTLALLESINTEDAMQYQIFLDDDIISKALVPIERMLEFS